MVQSTQVTWWTEILDRTMELNGKLSALKYYQVIKKQKQNNNNNNNKTRTLNKECNCK